MSFIRTASSEAGPSVWTVQFLEADLRTNIGRKRHFASDAKLRELVERTPTHLKLEDQQAFDYALQVGRGGLNLQLTQAQYGKLWGDK